MAEKSCPSFSSSKFKTLQKCQAKKQKNKKKQKATHILNVCSKYQLLAFASGIELKFRVNRVGLADPVNALLLFAASDGEQEEYIVIQLRDGRPWFLFDPQGGAAATTPTNDGGKTYDDGEWHHVLVTRNGFLGQITVDGVYTGMNMRIGY